MSAEIAKAADWLQSQARAPHPIIPIIRRQFGLTAVQAVAAIREANRMRDIGHKE